MVYSLNKITQSNNFLKLSEKIKQISGINFDNADEVLAVSNGLIIYKMLKEIE